MSVPSFTDQQRAWQRVPIDDRGYRDTADLLQLDDDALRAMTRDLERVRYGGWRNHEGRWRRALGLDDTHGKRVLDYGCGFGLEALQYAKAGNEVLVADINAATVALAQRVLRLHGYRSLGGVIGDASSQRLALPARHLDVVHCVGVLHHIPDPRPTMEQLRRWLRPGGELRLMVYSAQAWQRVCGTDPPEDVAGHPLRERFTRHMDAVGDWADWYDRERLEGRFGDLFAIRHLEHLTPDGQYLAAILTPRRTKR